MFKIITASANKSLFSYIIYFIFNCTLAITSISITAITGNPLLGIFFIILSKWRMFAVHPYHWMANISANLVDLITGTSIILLSLPAPKSSPDFLAIHLILIFFYIIWLNFLKPGSSLKFAESQSIIAIFLGTNTATILLNKSSLLFTILVFFITYASFKHLLIQTEETKIRFPSIIFGMIFALIAWALRFWLTIYGFEGTGIIITQISIILCLIAFAIFRIYISILHHDGKAKPQEIVAPIIFSTIIIIIMLTIISNPIFNI